MSSLKKNSSASAPSRDDLETRAAAIVILEERRKKFPLYYFEPNPKLEGFFESRAPILMLTGANRCGKSEHLSAHLCANAIGYKPWVLRQMGIPEPENPWMRPDNCPPEALCYDGAQIRLPIPNRGFVITGLNFRLGIGETLYPKIQSYLKPWITEEIVAHKGIPGELTLKNGSKIVFGSALQQGLAFEGTAFHHYAVDEPIERRVYTGLRRGAVDHFARIVFAYTPIGPNAGWMFRDLYTRADGKRIDNYNLTIFDNPYLSPEAVEEWSNDPAISQIEREARIYGKFTSLADRIWPEYNEDVHVVPDFRPPSHWDCGCVIDPHQIKPWAIAWFAVAPSGEIYFYQEYPTSDYDKLRRDSRSIQDWALTILRLEEGRPMRWRFIDPNFGPRQDVLRGRYVPSVKDDLSRYGIHCYSEIVDDLFYGEGRVRALLNYDREREATALNRPKLFFTESCRNLRLAMQFYSPETSKEFPDPKKREQTWKDFADCVRYVAVSEVGGAVSPPSIIEDYIRGKYEPENLPEFSAYGEPLD